MVNESEPLPAATAVSAVAATAADASMAAQIRCTATSGRVARSTCQHNSLLATQWHLFLQKLNKL